MTAAFFVFEQGLARFAETAGGTRTATAGRTGAKMGLACVTVAAALSPTDRDGGCAHG